MNNGLKYAYSASCSLPDLFKIQQQYYNSYIKNVVVIGGINLEIIVLNEVFIDVIDLIFILTNITCYTVQSLKKLSLISISLMAPSVSRRSLSM